MDNNKCAVIFGGSGFIGAFFAVHLVEKVGYKKVYIHDIEAIENKSSNYRRKMLSSYAEIIPVFGDVRNTIDWTPAEVITLVANFSAVHREPGHEDYEYYQSNLLGAENVCCWSERMNCQQIIFTSSIAPYGVSEEQRDESSLPVPTTAYGSSKLAAEKIHQIWQAKDQRRQLVIVRPGVVFGPGEGGNVSRLIKAVKNHYFFYMGNKKTRKAGIYVKELCNAMTWVLGSSKVSGLTLFNMSMNPGPSVEEYVDAICKIASCRNLVPSVPYYAILWCAYIIEIFAKPIGLNHPFSPVRIKKLVRSNNIIPTYLVDNGYEYIYTLEEAFHDWKVECPEEWS